LEYGLGQRVWIEGRHVEAVCEHMIQLTALFFQHVWIERA